MKIKYSLLLLVAFVASCGFPTQPTTQNQTEAKKPLTLAEKLEIIEYKTGYYYMGGYNYAPMVILKIKNTSDEEISNSIQFPYVFTSEEGEELTNSTEYFQYSYQVPLSAGGIRQIYFQANTYYSIVNFRKNIETGKKVTCSIYLRGNLWKTFEVENELLASNRI